ncbi:hypothetical protein [Paenibacillus sp. FSL R7-0272]|uniref:hypothetical protein n=1 Tax=Paenibacillus sp. FSL R7-0272 TaxID=2921679 RepID=UPI0030EF2EE8
MDRLRAIVDFGHKQQKDEAGLCLLRLFLQFTASFHFPASYLLLVGTTGFGVFGGCGSAKSIASLNELFLRCLLT